MAMIIKDRKELEIKCSPVSIKEGEEIGVRLLHELRESENGIGLAANQIGINKRVCVVNVKEPLVLINPKIVEKSKEKFVHLVEKDLDVGLYLFFHVKAGQKVFQLH